MIRVALNSVQAFLLKRELQNEHLVITKSLMCYVWFDKALVDLSHTMRLVKWLLKLALKSYFKK